MDDEIAEVEIPQGGESQRITSNFIPEEVVTSKEEVVAIAMDEPVMEELEEYQIVEQDVIDSGDSTTETLYVISTVLDEETGELINVMTPVSSESTIMMEMENVDAGEIELLHNASGNKNTEFPETGESEAQLQDNEPLEKHVLSEHDYGVDINNRLIEIIHDNDTSSPSTSAQIAFEKEVADQIRFLTEDEPQFSSMPSSKLKKKQKMKQNLKSNVNVVVSKPRVRNIDLMDLPFTYAGQSFTVQAQKLILNVYDFFKRNKHNVYALDRIGTPQERASKCLNISSSAIGKIRRKYKSGKLEVPRRRKPKIKKVLDTVDPEKEEIIRDILRERLNNGGCTSLPALHAEARQRINFVGSLTSFSRLLQRMGFKCSDPTNWSILADQQQQLTSKPLS